jgi:P2-related tail formation protein
MPALASLLQRHHDREAISAGQYLRRASNAWAVAGTTEFFEERVAMMNWWSNRLDELRA